MVEKDKQISYLNTLKFDKNLWNSIQAKYIVNVRLVILLIISIVGIGIASYISLPRRLNPEIKIPIVVINTILPGASPEDVEQLVTVPLEDKLNSVKGLDTITSSSVNSSSTIVLNFLSSVDVEKARTDTQGLVDQVKLPTDAKTPSVTSIDFENQPVWTFTVIAKSDKASLMRFSRQLRDKLKDLPKVDKVTLSGFESQDIEVTLDLAKINSYGLNPAVLSQIVSRATSSYPAGDIKTGASTFALTIDKDVVTVDDVRNLRINAGNESLRLGDIATITERSKPDQNHTYYASAQTKAKPTVTFFVFKTSSSNIDTAEQEAHKVVDATVKQYDGQFTITTIENTAEMIKKQFDDLFNEFVSTIVLVFILLLVFLGLRQAIIASLTVPLTFLSAFAIIRIFGLTLNFLTMFAFLIALGLLIDDTIVTVAAMTRYYRTGKFTTAETGVLVWRDFIVPLWSTTITTIWAFVPLLIASGIIGEFIKSIPIVVTATLLSSTTVAVLITLPLMIIFLKPQFPKRLSILFRVLALIIAIAVLYFFLPKNVLLPIILLIFLAFVFITYRARRALGDKVSGALDKNPKVREFTTSASYAVDNGLLNIEGLSHRYMGVIDRILRSKHGRRNTIIAIIIFAVVAYLLVPLGLVQNEFFPKTNEDLVYMSLEMPAGTNLATTNAEALNVLERVRKTEVANFVIAETGTGVGSDGNRSNNPNNVLYTLHLPPKEKRSVTSQDLAERLRARYKDYSRGNLTVTEVSGGPPAGADVQVKLLGDDLNVLDQYASKVVDFLKKQPGVTSPGKSVKQGTGRLTFVPDKLKLAENGLTIDSVSLWLRTYASGFTLDTIKLNNEDTDIIFRTDSNAQTPEQLGSVMIPTQGSNGQLQSVPLLSLGKIKLENNPTLITREGGKRTISISAGVTKGTNATVKNADLLKFVEKDLHLPQGYTWATGGANEENQKSVQSILQAMLLSILLILVTMVIEFGSYRQTLIALLLIPLSISGVFYVFALTGTPLSFPALIGVLALFGIVVTHAIVVIEKINENREHGLPLREAIVDAAGNRLEPVLLTSLATIVGLIPVTLSDPLWRGLGGAIIAGLLFSGLIKLFFVPVVYYSWYKNDEDQKTQNAKRKAQSEEV